MKTIKFTKEEQEEYDFLKKQKPHWSDNQIRVYMNVMKFAEKEISKL